MPPLDIQAGNIESNLSTTAPLGMEESGWCGNVAIMGK